MGIIRRLREWREKVDGTLTGPSIETDSATINSRNADSFVTGIDQSAKKVQHGASNVKGPNAASDATWDTFSSKIDSVTFDEPFSATPSITHMKQQANGAELVTNVRNISTTGADFEKVNFSSKDFSGSFNKTYWIAVGDA